MSERTRIKLSGAQVTRVREALTRYHENCRTTDYDTKAAYIPPQLATEDLVNDILDVVCGDEGR
jgi:hypothetical protein